jgi:hypothetical protein
MKALIKDGLILKYGLSDDEPGSYDGEWVDQVETPAPLVEWPNIAIDNGLVIASDPARVERQWIIRERTPEERVRTWTALAFHERVSFYAPTAWKKLRLAARDNEPAAEMYEQAMAAQDIVSNDPRTLQFIQGAIAFGILTEEEADNILNAA